jgi:hypothetical protein
MIRANRSARVIAKKPESDPPFPPDPPYPPSPPRAVQGRRSDVEYRITPSPAENPGTPATARWGSARRVPAGRLGDWSCLEVDNE